MDKEMELLDTAMEEYVNKFDDSFPTMMFTNVSPEKMIEIINECISKAKTVYDLGYVESGIDVIY